MKRSIIGVILMVFIWDCLFAQPIGTINPSMTEKPWLDKETRIINDHAITMIFGERPTNYRHMNLGPITAISYQSPGQIADSIKNVAGKENWSDKDLQEKLDYYTSDAPGGIVNVFISRGDEDRANFRWFFLIIRNKVDKKMTEIYLDYQAPQLPEGNGWWNYTSVLIDKPVEMPFYVYLNDKQSNHLSDFKFEIQPVNK